MESVRAAGSEQKRGQKADQGCRAGIKVISVDRI